MFSLKVIDTDNFLEMGVSARELYFQFGMRADDDGFLGNPRRIMRMVGASEDDLKVLVAKKFIIPMATNGVCVITHWKTNNFIRPDRYDETQFKEEKARLSLVDGRYSFEFMNKIDPGIPNDIPKVDPGKVRLGQDSIEKEEKKSSPDKPETSISWLGVFNEKEEFKCGIPPETLKAFSEKYKASEGQIIGKAEDLVVWCKTNGRVKKNYKLFLQNILKREFGIRTEADKILQERIAATVGKSSSFAKELSKKMTVSRGGGAPEQKIPTLWELDGRYH